jgi:hypothetical protein
MWARPDTPITCERCGAICVIDTRHAKFIVTIWVVLMWLIACSILMRVCFGGIYPLLAAAIFALFFAVTVPVGLARIRLRPIRYFDVIQLSIPKAKE